MNTAVKLGAFGLVLAAALGGGAAVGDAVGPVAGDDPPAEAHDAHDAPAGAAAPLAGAPTGERLAPGGLSVSDGGYTLVADEVILASPSTRPFRFRITGPDGATVTGFAPRHERELHLVTVSTDLSGYAHHHPVRAPDGTWSATLGALAPGAYRAFADFAVAGGPELTLGVDLTVPGEVRPAPLPAPATVAAVDGYAVSLSGTPAAGTSTEVALAVERGGEPVRDLEPYLGAFGHLVAIRSGDLAYLHVHPQGEPPAAGARGGPTARFAVELPSPGDHRLFFDFSHRGAVHTAAFTLHVPAAGEPSTTTTATTPVTGHEGHQ